MQLFDQEKLQLLFDNPERQFNISINHSFWFSSVKTYPKNLSDIRQKNLYKKFIYQKVFQKSVQKIYIHMYQKIC